MSSKCHLSFAASMADGTAEHKIDVKSGGIQVIVGEIQVNLCGIQVILSGIQVIMQFTLSGHATSGHAQLATQLATQLRYPSGTVSL